MDVEEYIINESIRQCLEIPRIVKLVKRGRVMAFDIECTCQDAVVAQRSGVNGRMRGSDCIEAAKKAVTSKYKGLKL